MPSAGGAGSCCKTRPSSPFKLFDLRDDPLEEHDLAEQEPRSGRRPFPGAAASHPKGRRRPLATQVEPVSSPVTPAGRHHPGARASRPHTVPLAAAELQCNAAGSHPVGGNSSGQAVVEPWRRSRLIQVGEMAQAVPGIVRAGRPRSREAIIP